MRCAICKRNMMTPDGCLLIGFSFEIREPVTDDFKRIYPELPTGTRFDICMVCWLRKMGMEIRS